MGRRQTGARLQPGNMLTQAERHQLWVTLQDLRRQAERCTDPDRKTVLEQQILGVEMDRRSDKETRPPKRAQRPGRRERRQSCQ